MLYNFLSWSASLLQSCGVFRPPVARKDDVMCRAKTLGLAGVAALLSTASLAADLTPLPAPVPVYRPVVETGGWYFHGFIGASNEFLSRISHPDFLTAPQFAFIDKGGFNSAPF